MRYLLLLATLMAALTDPCLALESADSADSAQQFDAIAARYHRLLARRPQRGTAFDLLYRHYLDAGRLDALVAYYEEFTQRKPDQPAAHLLLGMLHARRSQSVEALAELSKAAKLARDDFRAPYYQGLLLSQLHRYPAAITALQTALKNKPTRSELLGIYKKLGQLQRRIGQNDAALKTWSTLAEKFPTDPFVVEELAELLANEEQFHASIRRYHQLITLCKDDTYRPLMAQVEIGQIQVRQGKLKAAIATLESCLGSVNPGSWLAEDIERKIESVFLRRNDLSGLTDYYRGRLQQRPDDLDVMVRLAAVTSRLGNAAAALEQYRAAVKLAPSRTDLREQQSITAMDVSRLPTNSDVKATIQTAADRGQQLVDEILRDEADQVLQRLQRALQQTQPPPDLAVFFSQFDAAPTTQRSAASVAAVAPVAHAAAAVPAAAAPAKPSPAVSLLSGLLQHARKTQQLEKLAAALFALATSRTASGQADDTVELLDRALPEGKIPPESRYQLALRFAERKAHADTVRILAPVWREKPELPMSRLSELAPLYAEANRIDALVAAFGQVQDMQLWQRYGHNIVNAAQRIGQQKEHLDDAVKLLREAAAIPQFDRKSYVWGTLGSLLSQNGRWAEAWDAYRQAVFPPTGPPNSVSSPYAGQLIDLSQQLGKLAALETECEKAVARYPDWAASGDLLLAMAQLRQRNEAPLTALANKYRNDSGYAMSLNPSQIVLRTELAKCKSRPPLELALDKELRQGTPPDLNPFFVLLPAPQRHRPPWPSSAATERARRGPRQLLPALLARARDQGKIDALAKSVEQARKRFPTHEMLSTLHALIQIERGDSEAASPCVDRWTERAARNLTLAQFGQALFLAQASAHDSVLQASGKRWAKALLQYASQDDALSCYVTPLLSDLPGDSP